MHLSTVKVSIDFWDWLTSIFSLILNFKHVFYQILRLLYICVVLYILRPSPVSVPHPSWLRTYTDSYARRQGCTKDREII